MLKHLLTCICLLTAMIASAQTTLVTGNVSDNTGEPLIGASIMQKGSTIGCTTDFDGNFSLKVATPATLVISYVGYHTKEVAIAAGQDKVDVVLSENTEVLDEVVVIGYGTMNRSKMSSSVASISTKELTKAPVGNVASAMQGRAAGVDVLQQGGIAGADVNIVVRGAASLTSTEPLYIVDGVFTNGGLSTLNPADIETMQVLKDGAAAAIYGSRAANGVVLITTKNGQKGKSKSRCQLLVQSSGHCPCSGFS